MVSLERTIDVVTISQIEKPATLRVRSFMPVLPGVRVDQSSSYALCACECI
jgi:hypothetical protein